MVDLRSFAQRRSLSSALLLLAALTVSTPTVAAAQDESTQEDALTQEDQEIIVQAERDRAKAARELAKDVTRSLRIRTPLERFRDPICPFVIGAEPQTAFAIESRIKANAELAGLEVGGKDCQKNMLIGFVADVREELETLLAEKRRSFGFLTSFERKRLGRESGPTRAWHVWVQGDEDGNPLLISPDGTPFSTSTGISRIGVRYTRLIQSSVVLIEQSATEGKTLEQIADFATMRGLMPVLEIEAGTQDMGTILSLFEDDAPVPGLTPFDVAYLKGYHSDRTLNKSGLGTMFEIGKRYARPSEDPEE